MNGNELSHERFERIEAYLLGTLSPEDRTRFEAELEADEQLREEVTLQREHIRAIQLGGFTRTLEQAAQRHSENDEGGQVLSLARSRRNWVPWAAAIAALVAVSIWALVRPPLNERVYAEFHVPDPGLPVPMGAAEDHAFHDAMVAYKLGDHAEALMKWEGLRRTGRDNDTLRYFIGCATLESGRAGEALSLFTPLASSPGPFQDKARWMLFMAAVKAGRTSLLDSLDLSNDPLLADRARRVRKALGRP